MVGIVRVFGAAPAATSGFRIIVHHRYFQGSIADLHRVGASGHLDDRSVIEVRGEPLRFDGGRGDDHLEIRPPRQQLTQIAQEEVDVEAAFVRLVEDQGVVAQQAPVALDLGEQDAVGHQLHQGAVAGLVGEADGVADCFAQRGAHLVGDALSHRARRQPARLGVADGSADPAAQLEADLGQLGGLARAGLAGDHHDLVVGDGFGDLVTAVTDRQIGVGDDRHRGFPGGDHGLGRRNLVGDLLHGRRGHLAAQGFQPPAQPGRVAEGQPVEAVAQLAHLLDGDLGHWRHNSAERR